MAVATVHVERMIKAEPHVVWGVITDLDAAPEVLSGVTKVERLEGEGYAVGVKWRETRRMFGKEASEDMWVVAVSAPLTTTVNAESNGTRYSTVFVCAPVDGGTLLSVDFGGEMVSPTLGQKIAWAMFGKIGLKSSRKALARDLEDIARAAESPT